MCPCVVFCSDGAENFIVGVVSLSDDGSQLEVPEVLLERCRYFLIVSLSVLRDYQFFGESDQHFHFTLPLHEIELNRNRIEMVY